ncbi:UDP-N-acetylmuramate dehydrogenase [Gilvimarinus sp. 1_MG-2023]|uniref:UDP-N-acetylmuramate dehydrogenase n=1 Tax=Gilvimarinus sp. 1_MG-2023 TaxID=3062638 RepID=UPI0026E3AC1A|nr:UDP-N-acetylmuramate dehydrogenase [Gilvimarinus sp. 1_MG-2023]MDO6746141.1 UDP-N-acetylmuramate dehydrogenase [Gilvimarinus sp. 1_MG-2023]
MPLILPEFDLSRLNTLAAPAKSKAYVSVKTTQELVEAIQLARAENWPVLPLGEGSNIVLAGDFPGMVVDINLKGIELEKEDDKHLWVRVQAGENWHDFVTYSLAMNWFGLENLSLIPGTVGAAPIQNIGAYGVELESVFAELSAVNIDSCLPVTFTRDGCGFSYRDSVFKQALRDQYIITSVLFKLSKTPDLQLQYPVLRKRLESVAPGQITAQLVSDVVCDIRREKLPDPNTLPNVGSFFKNPVISRSHFEQLRRAEPGVVGYPQRDDLVKLAAAWLIDRAGFKGRSLDGVSVHNKQALVLTNPAKLEGEKVLALARTIQKEIQDRFEVTLEIEPRIYP